MALIKDRHLASEKIELDGNSYEGCSFTRCHMIYNGGDLPTLSECVVTECSWSLGESAMRTIDFLRFMYAGGNQAVVEGFIKHIKSGAPLVN